MGQLYKRFRPLFYGFFFIFAFVKVLISTCFQFAAMGNKIAFFIVYFVGMLGVAYATFAV